MDGVGPTSAATLTDLGYVILVVANVPLAVMFTAIAVVSLRRRAFPIWLGWIAASAALAALLLSFSVVDPNGPLAPAGLAELPALCGADRVVGSGSHRDDPNRPWRPRRRGGVRRRREPAELTDHPAARPIAKCAVRRQSLSAIEG